MQKEVVLSKIDHKTIRPRDFPLGHSLGVGRTFGLAPCRAPGPQPGSDGSTTRPYASNLRALGWAGAWPQTCSDCPTALPAAGPATDLTCPRLPRPAGPARPAGRPAGTAASQPERESAPASRNPVTHDGGWCSSRLVLTAGQEPAWRYPRP